MSLIFPVTAPRSYRCSWLLRTVLELGPSSDFGRRYARIHEILAKRCPSLIPQLSGKEGYRWLRGILSIDHVNKLFSSIRISQVFRVDGGRHNDKRFGVLFFSAPMPLAPTN